MGQWRAQRRLLVQPGRREAYLRHLVTTGLLTQVRTAPGCEAYDFYLSVQSSDELLVQERWRDAGCRRAFYAAEAGKKLEESTARYVLQTVEED